MCKKVKRYLLIGMVMVTVLCSLTACTDDDYNDNQTENSVSSSDDEGADESSGNVQDADEEEVYEYQQIIDEDESGG